MDSTCLESPTIVLLCYNHRMAKRKELTDKQRKAIRYLIQALDGKMTYEAALKKAGYSDSSAKQQKIVMDSLRKTSVIQAALRKKQITEEFVAGEIHDAVTTLDKGKDHRGYLDMAVKLLDLYPASRVEVGDMDQALDEAEENADYAEWE